MSQPDHEIIRTALAAVLPDQEDIQGQEIVRLDPRPGRLDVAEPKSPKSAVDAWRAFCAVDGPGWLQNAHTQTILHGDGPAFSAALEQVASQDRWPVAGERVSTDGKTSCQLRRTAAGWEITALSEADSLDGLLFTHRLLSADLKQYLVYHVACRPQSVGGHQELRPVASRFVGFEPVEGNGPPSVLPPTAEAPSLQP